MEIHRSVPWGNRSTANGVLFNKLEDNTGMCMTTLSTPELGRLTCTGKKPQGARRISSLLTA
eukprot:800600-Lingulodinium_polyedra.AAC.1